MHQDLAKKFKITVLIALISLVLTGCGTIQTTVRGLSETTNLAILGKDIVGYKVYVNDIQKLQVEQKDLERFQTGVVGVRNSVRENSQKITIQLEPGFHNVKIEGAGRFIVETKILLSAGQTKELILER
jgi:starvation-inducible outer membrane lipoprotein